MTERILITQPIDASAMALLEAADLEIDVWPGPAPMPPSELRARIQGCSGLISMLTDPVDSALMEAGPLRVVAQHAVGVNNIDLDAARALGVPVGRMLGDLDGNGVEGSVVGSALGAAVGELPADGAAVGAVQMPMLPL